MLLSRISQPPPSSPTPEDIFSSALTTIFTDDTVNSHGTPGSYVTYRSPRFGDLKLCIPAHPDEEDGRKLFAHYLWNAAVLAADGIERASAEVEHVGEDIETNSDAEEGKVKWNRAYWDLRGKKVLELGAGTALPSLIAALSGAKSCMITDHPSSPALTTGTIQKNVDVNLSPPRESASKSPIQSHPHHDGDDTAQTARSLKTKANIQVLGYTWGTSTFYLPDKYGKPAPSHTTPSWFNRIIVADCLWMPSQHINLIRTILQFLPQEKSGSRRRKPSVDFSGSEPESRDLEAKKTKETAEEENRDEIQNGEVPCALVVAGFHTGRRIVADFFSLATEKQPQSQSPAPHSDNAGASTLVGAGKNSPHLNSDEAKSKPPDPATANTISLDPSTLTPSERAACGLLRLASIFEVDVDGNARPWLNERPGEGKWDAKRWCAVGVLVRR